MNELVLSTDQTMSSKEIAELTGKEHKNIMADIRVLIIQDAISQLNFQLSDYVSDRGKKYPMYNLDFEATMVLLTGYDAKRRSIVVKRWLTLEAENARLKSQEQERIADRQAARLECHVMTDSLQEIRAEAGKGTKGFHYSNEMEMINRIVLGMTAKKYRVAHKINSIDAIRDRLNLFQVKMVQLLQATNTALIQCDMSYKDRKKKLALLYEREAKKLAIK